MLASGALAATITLVTTPVVIALAKQRGWVAAPSADRWHSTPTALMGGIAIFAGVAIAGAAFATGHGLYLVGTAALLMFAAGAIDDRRGISPGLKLLIQLVAAVLLVADGYTFELGAGGPAGRWFSAGLTVFWLLGITNAVNLIDNMDGLSAGVTAIAAAALAGMALIAGAIPIAAAAMAVCGAALAFLRYNFKPAKIFMGDCGSLFLGFVLGALAVVVQAELGMRGITAVVMTALILGVPIMDTTLVTVARLLHDRPVSQGGRDHSSHRLVRSGLSERQAVLALYAVSAFFALVAALFYVAEIRVRVSVAVFALLAIGVFAVQIGSLEVYEKQSEGDDGSSRRRSFASVLLRLPRELFGPRWKPALAVPVDALTVSAAFVLAHYLRFESGLTAERAAFLVASVPVAVLVRLPLFALFGFYRAIWRHAGAYDIARVAAGVTAGSLLLVLALGVLHGFDGVSHGVLVIEWMAVTLGVLLSRFGFRGLRSYLSAVGASGTRVAVYGADLEGAETVRLLRGDGHSLRPVAIIDERPETRGRSLEGVTVAGGVNALEELKSRHGVEEIVLPDNHLDRGERQRVAAACRRLGVRCTTVKISVEPQEESTF